MSLFRILREYERGVVFDPGLLVPPAEFKHQLNELIERVRATPRQPGVGAIRIPSERAFRERERRRREGLAAAAHLRPDQRDPVHVVFVWAQGGEIGGHQIRVTVAEVP